ncbi:MAG: hypothetical protein HXS54_16940 [Theionarchaea archaeon]|nr:hypothetical protein [Theionarchaea archaeon]
MFIDFLFTSICLLFRTDANTYFRVSKSIGITRNKRVGIVLCVACVCILTYFTMEMETSILLLALIGSALSVFRLSWSWKILKEQIIDIIFLLCFSMILVTTFYGISYLPAVMTFLAVFRIYITGAYLKESEGRERLLSLLHEISVTILYTCSAALVIAIYTERENIILPFFIVGGVSLLVSLVIKRI